MSDVIIVTGPGSSAMANWGFADFFTVQASIYYAAFGTTLSYAGAGNPRDWSLPSTASLPGIRMEGLTSLQSSTVLQALENIDRDAALSDSLSDARTAGATVTISVVQNAPNWFEDQYQVGGVRFTGRDTNGDGRADEFQNGTNIEIVIVASRLATSDQTFAEAIAHEFTHLIRGSSGNFLRDTEIGNRDDQTYQNLFTVGDASLIEQSIDVTGVYNPSSGYHVFTGTASNNFFDGIKHSR